MRRRTLLAATAALPTLSAPALAQNANRVLRFVPEGNLNNPDPVWTTTTVARNHGLMIWDMLFALDDTYAPQPQMVEAHEVSEDRLTWRFRLREGLRFHDNEPVRPVDCITSIQRWARRRPLGQTLLERTEEMTWPDDRTIVIRLKRPYSLMLETLADYCFIMPERIAKTDPFTQITEFVGSGPFSFPRDQWISGSQAIYLRNENYRPRSGAPNFVSGGKVVHFDRVEWRVMPDYATAVSALGNGEVDWVQQPQVDLLPLMRRNRQIRVAVNDRIGVIGMVALNQTQPPFNNQKLRQALLPALNQQDFVTAALGTEPELFKVPAGIFTPGMPMANDEALDVLTGPRNLERARQMVRESGYNGERVVLMSPTDYPATMAIAQVANDLFKRIGLNVDFAVMDWGTLVQRRASKEPIDRGGWSAFCTTYEGLTVANPATHIPLRGNGPQAWFGWPVSPRLEALREQWLDAPDRDAQLSIARQMQRIAFEEVPYLPTGQHFNPTAYRTNLVDIVPASFPIFWGVRKT
ncbi:ABC transporter substrate-binding protein [Roseomonas sp. CCTCC AB2023176]|uniref:ABC transporter substrate-binding protein n=1 Tax=Roseomonas sp. CCTCC AB2023176 TaxID=3342640 RepID=UPI0035E0747E